MGTAVRNMPYCCRAVGTHVPYGITLCYLPPGRGDILAFTTAN